MKTGAWLLPIRLSLVLDRPADDTCAARGARRTQHPDHPAAGRSRPQLKRREMEPLYRARETRRDADGVGALRAAHQGDQRPQGEAQRRHPGAQLHDAGDLPLRRRFPRRQPAARQGSRAHEGRRHRAGRRALHGRDVEAAQSGQDGADPGSAARAARSRRRSRPRTCARCAPPIPACRSSPTSTPAPT